MWVFVFVPTQGTQGEGRRVKMQPKGPGPGSPLPREVGGGPAAPGTRPPRPAACALRKRVGLGQKNLLWRESISKDVMKWEFTSLFQDLIMPVQHNRHCSLCHRQDFQAPFCPRAPSPFKNIAYANLTTDFCLRLYIRAAGGLMKCSFFYISLINCSPH